MTSEASNVTCVFVKRFSQFDCFEIFRAKLCGWNISGIRMRNVAMYIRKT